MFRTISVTLSGRNESGSLKHAAPTELSWLIGHDAINIALLTEL